MMDELDQADDLEADIMWCEETYPAMLAELGRIVPNEDDYERAVRDYAERMLQRLIQQQHDWMYRLTEQDQEQLERDRDDPPSSRPWGWPET